MQFQDALVGGLLLRGLLGTALSTADLLITYQSADFKGFVVIRSFFFQDLVALFAVLAALYDLL